jgi:mycothiol synthase
MVGKRPVPPAGYTVRGAKMDDLPDMAALFLACDLHDWGEPDYTQEMIRENWTLPGLDLRRDVWIVEDTGGRAAAYAWLVARDRHRLMDGFGLVHPEHRGRGLGAFLVETREWRAAEQAGRADPGAEVVIRDGVIAPDTAAHELLRSRGYALVRHFSRMDIRLERKHRRPTKPPPGIEIRTFVKGFDDHAVHAALEESFAEHWGWIARPFEEWAAHRLDDPQFDARLWFVAEDLRSDRRDVAGVLVGGLDAEMGIVHTLGVRDRWRGRGVGRALLRRSFAAFAARGIRDVVLFVDAQNETGATRLYERVGMHTARRYDMFEKPLVLPARRLGRREDERAR